jgi:predicted transcriptional regulator
MNTSNDEVLAVLKEIRDILSRIYTCHEGDYVEIQRRKVREEWEALEDMLTPVRREIFPLLFDARRLSQVEIAAEANTSQPTVSRFISTLLDQGLIEQTKYEDGSIAYHDKYDLAPLLQI